MAKNLWLKRFDPSDSFTWRRAYGDNTAGETVVNKDFTPRRLRQLYEGRIIVATDIWNEFVGASSPATDKSRVVVDSAPVSDAALIREQLDALGVEYDKRWGEKRLNEELEKATAPVTSLPGIADGAA